MSRWSAWIRKELREQRGALIGVGMAVVLITAAPYVVMPDEITPQQLDRIPAIAIALATLVLGLDLFARETRRGTHALILRTPGAFRIAFAAKLAVFLLGVAVTLGAEEAVRHGLTAATGVPYPTMLRPVGDQGLQRIPRDMTPEYLFGIRSALFLVLLALAVGTWHVVGSVISPRAGVGALFGVLGLAVLGIPLALLFSHHPWWFRLPTSEAFGWVAGLLLAGLVVATFAWFRGRRHLFPRRRAAMQAGLVGLVLCGLATGATARAIDRWETPDANAPELRIQRGMTELGAGGTHLYVTTSRGPMAGGLESADRGRREQAAPRSSPPTAWTINLSRGAAVEDSRFGSYFSHLPFVGTGWSPVPFIVRVRTTPPDTYRRDDVHTWIDTRTNEPLFDARDRTFDPRTVAATRAVAKATTPGRDSKGRRVWRLFGFVERDGDEDRVPPNTRVSGQSGLDAWITSPGVHGWMGAGWIPGSNPQKFGRWRIDVESGVAKELPSPVSGTTTWEDLGAFGSGTYGRVDDGRRSSTGLLLDDERRIYRYTGTKADGASFDSGWQVVEYVTGVSRPLGRPRLDYDVELVDVGTLLIRDPVDTSTSVAGAATRLTLWKPIADQRRLVTSPDPSLLSVGWIESRGQMPDGRWMIQLDEAPGFRTGRVAVALLDAKSAVLTPLTTWSDASLDPIAVDVDGSFLAIEDGRRVVRFSDAGARRVVVWPK